ncbi:MAG: hypothetical protein U0939_17000 [Pirellulales bacterium]
MSRTSRCLSKLASNVARLLSACCLTVCCLTATVSVDASRANAAEPLRWKFKTGERLQLDWSQRSETESTVGDKPWRLVVESQLGLVWNVTNVAEDGTATITQSIRRLKVRVDLPPADPLEFDSEALGKPTGDEQALADSLRPLIGPAWTLELGARGDLRKAEASPELTAAFAQAGVNGRLRQWFSTTEQGGFLKALFVALPEGAVEPGASWESRSETKSSLGPVAVQMTYKLRGPETRDDRPLQIVDVVGQVKLGDQAAGAGARRTLKSQKMEGELAFDAAAGRLTDSRQTLTLTTETRVRETLLEVRASSVSTLRLRELPK